MLDSFDRKDVSPLRYWVHAILPLVYDDSLSYYEVLAKVGQKMNEVIEGLNANNEQVEKVTQFTVEQVQNLTMAFNNFQQSMLDRQGQFENKLLDEQHSFETQLDGEIAQWEEDTTEKFNQMYQGFLSAYQRQFGVVQVTGDSSTDVMSQKGATDSFFQTPHLINADNVTVQLPDADAPAHSGSYLLVFARGETNIPAHLPFSSWPNSNVGLLLTMQHNHGITTTGDIELLFLGNQRWIRQFGEDSWSNWTTTDVLQVPGDSTTDVMSQKGATDSFFQTPHLINAGNVTVQLPDADAPAHSGSYLLVFARGETNIPAHLPFSSWPNSNVGLLLTMQHNHGITTTGDIELLFLGNQRWIRQFGEDSWSNWTTTDVLQVPGDSTTDVMSQKGATDSFFGEPIVVTPGNYTTTLPDANTANKRAIYNIVFASGAVDITANLPLNTWYGNDVGILFNMSTHYGYGAGNTQLFYRSGVWYFRQRSDEAWSTWRTYEQVTTFHVGKNGEQYSSILRAIKDAITVPNATVYIGAGEYDLIEEFKEYYGDDWFDTYSGYDAGIFLGNGVKLVFSSNSIVKCNYTGNNQDILNYFSPFHSYVGDFTIENLRLESSRTRYAIHDEQASDSTRYTHKYLNCNIKHDNSAVESGLYKNCIGGGLGTNGEVIIENCIFESVANEANDVSYHNSPANGRSNIVITGCYFSSTVSFRWYGPSTEISTMLVSNCSCKIPPYTRAETADAKIENIKLISFNNEIRS